MTSSDREPHEPEKSGSTEHTQHTVHELLDRYHDRASMTDGDQVVIDPGQVLDNIAFAMERVDTDIDTPVSIDDDVVPVNELWTLVQGLQMGPTLAIHVVNIAMRIMAARYPDELVRAPLPEAFDLRAIHPAIDLTDQQHEISKTIFNLRTTSATDLTEHDVESEMNPLDAGGKANVFVGLFYMVGTKIGAMKHRTGIE